MGFALVVERSKIVKVPESGLSGPEMAKNYFESIFLFYICRPTYPVITERLLL